MLQCLKETLDVLLSSSAKDQQYFHNCFKVTIAICAIFLIRTGMTVNFFNSEYSAVLVHR